MILNPSMTSIKTRESVSQKNQGNQGRADKFPMFPRSLKTQSSKLQRTINNPKMLILSISDSAVDSETPHHASGHKKVKITFNQSFSSFSWSKIKFVNSRVLQFDKKSQKFEKRRIF